jgi:ankyrin repeat protein
MEKKEDHYNELKGTWFKAIINRQMDIIKSFIEGKKIDLETTWKYLNLGVCTALHIAILKNYIDVTKLLLENGSITTTKTSEGGYAPIHLAACNESPEILELLLSYRESLDIEDQIGFTPLLLASVYCREKNIELLLKAGSKIDHREHDGDTALHFW